MVFKLNVLKEIRWVLDNQRVMGGNIGECLRAMVDTTPQPAQVGRPSRQLLCYSLH